MENWCIKGSSIPPDKKDWFSEWYFNHVDARHGKLPIFDHVYYHVKGIKVLARIFPNDYYTETYTFTNDAPFFNSTVRLFNEMDFGLYEHLKPIVIFKIGKQ